jgi:hypothetical protein
VADVAHPSCCRAPLPAGEAANCVAVGKIPNDSRSKQAPGRGADRSSSCSSAGVAHEFEIPASGDMAHA